MVFCGLFPTDADQFNDLREALGRLQLNDAALSFEPEVRSTLDSGLRSPSQREWPSPSPRGNPKIRLLGGKGGGKTL